MNDTPYTTSQVTSADGTIIGYRQIGQGPALVLVHGAMMYSGNFNKLATELSDQFTVYVPDRRGRGLSGPHGDNYDMQKEVEDLQALLTKSGAQFLFGLSSGALISLQTALKTPAVRKLALYEPPLPIEGEASPRAWDVRFNQELEQGDLANAMATAMKGTGDGFFVNLPRFIISRLMRLAIAEDIKNKKPGTVPLGEIIPTAHYDPLLVKEMEGSLQTFAGVQAQVLLLGGSRSQRYLKTALVALSKTLPNSQLITLRGVGHNAADNGDKPSLVANKLKEFFQTKVA